MERLFIITPKDGAFQKYMSRFEFTYKKFHESANCAFFAYNGSLSPKDKVRELLSIYDFKEYFLDKEKNYYIFKAYIE